MVNWVGVSELSTKEHTRLVKKSKLKKKGEFFSNKELLSRDRWSVTKHKNIPSTASVFGAAMASSTAVGSRPLERESEIIELSLWAIDFDDVVSGKSSSLR